MGTAIVTGGGSGIGAATAIALHEAGHEVLAVGLDRTEDLPGHIRYEELDLSQRDRVAAVFGQFEKVSALINCAGILRHEREWDYEHFSAVLDVNVSAVLECAKAARPGLASAGGAIVNIASMWSYFGSPKSPAYATSKSAIVGLTRSLAVAWAEEGIRVNAVAPGWIRTRMAAKALADPERSAKIGARIPVQRWGEPGDVASVIRFLVSQDAQYVTGAVLPVDGGYSIA